MTVKEAAEVFQRAGAAFDPDATGRRAPKVTAPERPQPVTGSVDVRLVLHGHCPVKKNAWQRGTTGKMFLDSTVTKQIEALTLQILFQWGNVGPVEHPELTFSFFVHHARRDRDGMLTTVLDCLQAAGVLVNDNLAHANGRLSLEPAVFVDAADERVEIVVEKK